MASERSIRQYLYTADRIRNALEVQHDRLLEHHERWSDDADREVAERTVVDMELFVVCLQRLGELCRQVRDRLHIEAAGSIVEDFRSGFPAVKDLRDLIMHPAPIEHGSSRDAISDALTMWIPGPPGRVSQRVIDVPTDYEYALTIHARIVEALTEALGGSPQRTRNGPTTRG